MKTLVLSLVTLSFLVSSCRKDATAPTVTTTQLDGSNTGGSVTTPVVSRKSGYVVIKCDNCSIDYGMPDQFRNYSVSGVSPKFTFTYAPGYTLHAYLKSTNAEQLITYTVYDSENAVVYSGSKTQPGTGYWDVSVPLN